MRRFRDIPIRQKLVIILMATTGAALLLAGLGIIVSDSILFREYLQRDLSALARIIADNGTAAVDFDDPRTAHEMLASLRARQHIETVCMYRANGTVLASYSRPGSNSPCPPPGASKQIQWLSGKLILSRAIVLLGRPIGELVLRYDLGEVYERQKLYGATVLGVLLASSLIALLLSTRLRAVIATPISRLADTATSIAETKDYNIRAEKVSSDELGVLVDAFNGMLEGIQSREADLRRALLAREAALLEAQNARNSLNTILASIGDAVVSTDLEGRVVFANPIARSLLKCTEEDLVGKPLDEVFQTVHELTREKVESPVTRALRDGPTAGVTSHTILITCDGAETPIDESGAPIRGEAGTVQGVVLVFRDVTGRRRAEETRHLLASIVESSEDAIVGQDLNGIVTSWNRGAERIYGYSAGEMIGQPSSLLAVSEFQDDIPPILNRIKQGERIGQYQTVRRTKSGKMIHVSVVASPIFDAVGRVVGASRIARDITEQVAAAERLAQLNAELRGSNESLARSNEDLERFAYVASHDLQEPLRMITVYSQLLVRAFPGDLQGQASGFVSNIVDGTARMRELLADLLAYTEISNGLDSPAEAVDMNVLFEKVLSNLKIAISESGAVITADRLPALRVYEAHFASLFQNLIGNAIKYRSAQPPRIHVSAQSTGGDLRFAVSDNGIGIDPEYHRKIFAAFKRLHGKQIPGTGIGLAICQRIVETYGGAIWVESAAGAGSTFVFTLPKRLQVEEEN